MHRNMKACFHKLGKCIAGFFYRSLCTITIRGEMKACAFASLIIV